MRRLLTSGVLLLSAVAVPVPRLHGQAAQTDQISAFEVASVKPSASRDTAMRIMWPRGRFSAVNIDHVEKPTPD
jgi:hypothetical protein